jgi:hypothetical protein
MPEFPPIMVTLIPRGQSHAKKSRMHWLSHFGTSRIVDNFKIVEKRLFL